MIGLRRFLDLGQRQAEVNIAPLIDMVFILLIFFIVTTSFVRDTGVAVRKPKAAAGEPMDRRVIRVAVTAAGTIHMDGRQIGALSLRGMVRDRLRGGDLPVLIVADGASRTRALVDVIDECKLAGATDINVATEAER